MKHTTTMKTIAIAAGLAALLNGCNEKFPTKKEDARDAGTLYVPSDCEEIKSIAESRRGVSLTCEDAQGDTIYYTASEIGPHVGWYRYSVKRAQ